MTARDLTPADFEVLEFERALWRHQGRKAGVALERFGLTTTRYYQRLDSIIDHPQAVAYNAQLIGQLRRIRDKRRGQRTARTRGIEVADARR